jgi:glucose-1-phosphate thymidylyltransferase
LYSKQTSQSLVPRSRYSPHSRRLDDGKTRALTVRQGSAGRPPDEIVYRAGWIARDQLAARAELFRKNGYGSSLRTLLD